MPGREGVRQEGPGSRAPGLGGFRNTIEVSEFDEERACAERDMA
jgi:hypothetical protein